MKDKEIDLHIHSTMSDGTLTPEEIVREAQSVGLRAIALTDHDSIAGIAAAQKAAEGTDLEVVAGVELSTYDGKEMHILGYFIQPEQTALKQFLQQMQDSRTERVEAMVQKLVRGGFSVSMEEVCERAKHMVGRVHIAQCLIEKGYAKTIGETFERFLGEGKTYYVPRRQTTPQEAIQIIHASGGVAVLAHPYFLQDDEALEQVLKSLPELDGMECHYPRHTVVQRAQYRRLAKRFGLLETGGSDFHGANRPDAPLGKGCNGEAIAYAYLEKLKEYRKQRQISGEI